MMEQTGRSSVRRLFVAETAAQAILAMKAELGTEAFIISQRKVKKGGILGIGARDMVEVVGELIPDWLRKKRPTELPRAAALNHQGTDRRAWEELSGQLVKNLIRQHRQKMDQQGGDRISKVINPGHDWVSGDDVGLFADSDEGLENDSESGSSLIAREVPGGGGGYGAYGRSSAKATEKGPMRDAVNAAPNTDLMRGVGRQARRGQTRLGQGRPDGAARSAAPTLSPGKNSSNVNASRVQPVKSSAARDGRQAVTADHSHGPSRTSDRTQQELQTIKEQVSEMRHLMMQFMGHAQGDRETNVEMEDLQRETKRESDAWVGTEADEAASRDVSDDVSEVAALDAPMGSPSTTGSIELPRILDEFHDRLKNSGVEASLAARIVENVAARTARDEYEDEELIRARLGKEIGSMIQIGSLPDPEDRPLVVVVVGATGVGKTTTLAKLGAVFSHEESRSIAYITMDHYRVAAVEQLRTYSDILNAPFEAVTTGEEMAAAIDRYMDREVILVDTAGRSPYDAVAIHELKQALDGLQLEPEVLLLISASTRLEEMDAVLKNFGVSDHLRLCFTKVDETVQWGPIFSLAVRSRIPVAYCTTGQNVPDDIEPALCSRFISALLGPEPGRDDMGGFVNSRATRAAGVSGASVPGAPVITVAR